MNKAECEKMVEGYARDDIMPLNVACAFEALEEDRAQRAAHDLIRKIEKYAAQYEMSKREKLLYLLPQYEDHLRSIFVDWEHDEPWAYTTDEHRDFVDIMREYIASISE